MANFPSFEQTEFPSQTVHIDINS
jgi:hypothetical protein